MKNEKFGLIVILILAGLVVGVVFIFFVYPVLFPPNMYNLIQSQQITMTNYGFAVVGTPLTVSLKNTGTGAVNLADSQYELCWRVPDTTESACEWLTPAQDSCPNPSSVSPNVTCQLIFNLPADVVQAMQSSCPPYCQLPVSEFSFEVYIPTGLTFQYAVVYGGSPYPTTQSQTLGQVYVGSVKIPALTQGNCGEYFIQDFDSTAGKVLTGSVSASGTVNVFVMTSAVYQVWQKQVFNGVNCTPSSIIAGQMNITSFSFNTTIPATGSYVLVVENQSPSAVTAQITVNLTS